MIHMALPRIICPVDFSSGSQRACGYAVTLGKTFGSQVVLLHAVPAAMSSQFGAIAEEGRFEEAQRAAAQQTLHEWTATAAKAHRQTTELLRVGEPLDVIVAVSHELPADLIVMGTHGRRGFERLWLGSVTERVVRKVSCPVLTIPPGLEASAGRPIHIERVLCAFDGSPSAREALRYAVSLARELRGSLTVLTAVEPVPEPLHPARFDVAAFQKERDALARERLNGALSGVRGTSPIDERVEDGRPKTVILGTAKNLNSDLIVMGVRGPHPVDDLVLGSTTDYVLRRAGCPVLVVREPAESSSA